MDELPRKSLREWRRERYLTQGELGALVGVTLYSISNWELGIKEPRVKHLRAVAAALGIQPQQIILPERSKGSPAAA